MSIRDILHRWVDYSKQRAQELQQQIDRTVEVVQSEIKGLTEHPWQAVQDQYTTVTDRVHRLFQADKTIVQKGKKAVFSHPARVWGWQSIAAKGTKRFVENPQTNSPLRPEMTLPFWKGAYHLGKSALLSPYQQGEQVLIDLSNRQRIQESPNLFLAEMRKNPGYLMGPGWQVAFTLREGALSSLNQAVQGAHGKGNTAVQEVNNLFGTRIAVVNPGDAINAETLADSLVGVVGVAMAVEGGRDLGGIGEVSPPPGSGAPSSAPPAGRRASQMTPSLFHQKISQLARDIHSPANRESLRQLVHKNPRYAHVILAEYLKSLPDELCANGAQTETVRVLDERLRDIIESARNSSEQGEVSFLTGSPEQFEFGSQAGRARFFSAAIDQWIILTQVAELRSPTRPVAFDWLYKKLRQEEPLQAGWSDPLLDEPNQRPHALWRQGPRPENRQQVYRGVNYEPQDSRNLTSQAQVDRWIIHRFDIPVRMQDIAYEITRRFADNLNFENNVGRLREIAYQNPRLGPQILVTLWKAIPVEWRLANAAKVSDIFRKLKEEILTSFQEEVAPTGQRVIRENLDFKGGELLWVPELSALKTAVQKAGGVSELLDLL